MRESILLKYDVATEEELEEFLYNAAFEEAKLFRSRMGVRLLRRKHLKKIEEWSADITLGLNVEEVKLSQVMWVEGTSWITNLRALEAAISLGFRQIFQASGVYEMHFALEGLERAVTTWEDFVLKSDLELLEEQVHSKEQLPTAEAIQFLLKGEEASALNLLRKEKTRLSAFIK
jgi:capsule polysaccharide export protein KpsC/LpsZ